MNTVIALSIGASLGAIARWALGQWLKRGRACRHRLGDLGVQLYRRLPHWHWLCVASQPAGD